MRPTLAKTALFIYLTVLQFLIFLHPISKAKGNLHFKLPNLTQKERANMALARKEYEKAIPDFVQLVQEKNADSYIFRGFVKTFYGADRIDEADAMLVHLEKNNPNSSALKFGQGLSAFYQGKLDRAESYIKSSLKMDSENALSWNVWSALLTEQGGYEDAIKKNWKAIELDPTERIFFENLRAICKRMSRPGLFVKKYKEQLQKDDKSIALGFAKVLARELRQEGFKRYAQNDLDSAIKSFLKMEELYKEVEYIPGIVPALFSLGLLYEEKGEKKRSQLYFQEVLKLNPRHLQARDKIDGNFQFK